jgi:hypothetical protein
MVNFFKETLMVNWFKISVEFYARLTFCAHMNW